jgi:hypothetical protein
MSMQTDQGLSWVTYICTLLYILIVNTHQPLASMSWSMHCMFAKINLRSADKVI